jgi:hypothetical protein
MNAELFVLTEALTTEFDYDEAQLNRGSRGFI